MDSSYCKEVQEIKAQFQELDTNGDGLLNYKELSVVMKELNPAFDYKDLLQLFRRVDKDGNGSIDFYEFIDFVFAGYTAHSPSADGSGGSAASRRAVGIAGSAAGNSGATQGSANLAATMATLRSLSGSGTATSSGPLPASDYLAASSLDMTTRKPPSSVDSLATFRDLAGGADVCAIELVEERGITLLQLEALHAHISRRCEAEAWSDLQRVSPTFRQPLDALKINLYQVVDWVVKPATERAQCSFVEFVATCPQEQRPRWFVSHWWGEPLLDFITCIRCHCADRDLGEHSPYWICAYANNQWNVHAELGTDPAESSFHKAMLKAEGTISVIDASAVCYTRVWCCYEVWLSLGLSATRSWPFRYDMYMAVPGDTAVGLTDGLAPADMLNDERLWVQDKVERESRFPLNVAHRMLNVRLQDAEASCDEDRMRILNCILGATDVDGYLPPAEDERYDELNAALSGRFAVAMWRNALEARQTMTDYGAALYSSGLCRLHVALSNSDAFTDKAAEMLGAGLPSSLQEVDLDFSDTRITNIDALSANFVRLNRLNGLKLTFTRCARLKHLHGLDMGMRGLGALSTLWVCFQACERLRSIDELGRGLAATSNLTSLHLNFHHCASLQSIDEFGAGLGQLRGLRSLTLFFTGCTELVSADPLGRGLAELTELTSLHLSMNGCNGLQDVDGLGRGLAPLTRLSKLHLYLDNIEQLASIQEISCSLVNMKALLSLELWFSNTAVGSIEDLGQHCFFQRDLENFSLNARSCKNLPEGLQTQFESLEQFRQKLSEEA